MGADGRLTAITGWRELTFNSENPGDRHSGTHYGFAAR